MTQDTGVPAEPRRFRTDVLMMFSSKVTLLVLNLAGSIIAARALGPTDRGTFAVAFSLTALLIQLGSFGLTTANPYFAARDPRSRSAIVTNSLWLAAALGALLIGIGVGLKALAPVTVEGVSWEELLVALVGIPAALVTLFLHSVLLGEGRTVAYNAYEVLLGALSVMALAIGFFVFDMGVLGALLVMLGGHFAGAITWFVLLRRHAQRLARPDPRLAWEMLKYGGRIYLAALIYYLIVRLDLLLVNSYQGATETGLYSVTVALGDALYLIPLAVAVNLFPRIARGGSHQMTAEVFRSMLVIYGAACLLSVPLAEPAVRLLYGSDFEGAVELWYWLVPGIFCLGMLNILSHHFAGKGFPIEAGLIFLPGLVLNLGINLVFLGEGTYVAALASTIAYALLLFLHMRLFVRETGRWSSFRPRVREVVAFVRQALGRAPSG
jgi:O-antigen/teichoic acid export membrane protein